MLDSVPGRWVSLCRAGVQLLLDAGGPYLPRLVHWGAVVGEPTADQVAALPGGVCAPPAAGDGWADVPLTLSPSRAQGWAGWPGLSGHRGGVAGQPLFQLDGVAVDDAGDDARFTYQGTDAAAGLRLDGELVLTAEGVLRVRQTLTSLAPVDAAPYEVTDLISLLPVPRHVAELFDHGGRWSAEARPQRAPLREGTWLREQRRGRTGPDSPLLLLAGVSGFDHRHGEVWGVHLGWSGDQRYLAQRLNTGETLLGAGELLHPGEVLLAAGESVRTPWLYAVYDGRGVDGLSARLHRWLRRRPAHPRRPRPVTLNTWEAVYFDQSPDKLLPLVDAAAAAGVERFVVDDGWFGARRDARSGLGDWWVSPRLWPEGLTPLAERVRERGMEFGLWFEPEMVNPDSELARAHPDWVLGTPGRMPAPFRYQQPLDVAHPDAYACLLERMSALVGEIGVAYIKWDHNRDLPDPTHRGGPRAGRPASRALVEAAYRLMAELKQRHPGLEIESCSSGGSRIDLGVLEHTDRVWASDCNDPLERIGIVRGVSTLLPLELIGAHIGPVPSHTTGRVHGLPFRMAVALFGHAGLEWDIAALEPAERADVAAWAALVKHVRALLHGGDLVRVDRPEDPGSALHGVVSPARDAALFVFARLTTGSAARSAPLRLAGLDPARRYEVRRLWLPGEERGHERHGLREPADAFTVDGALLARAGFAAPLLWPEQAAVFELRAV